MRLLRLLPCLLAAIPATLSNSGATAQDCYYVTDLRELGASLYDLPTFAINDDGVVAFTAKVDNRFHAFVWLPVEEYGLPAGVPIDIHPQGLGVSADDSAVHDISNSGYVVGVLDQFTTAPRAFAWKLGNPIVPLDLSDPTQFPPPAGYEEFIPRQLFGVNDNPTPMAVGYADSLWQCGCPPSGAPEVSTVLGFSVTLQAGSGFNVQEPKVDPDNDDCDQSTVSRDINNAYEVVGSSSKAGGPSCYPPSGECVPDARDAASWSYDPPFVELVDLGTQSEVLRNNHGGQLVGVGWEDDGPCDNDAMFWESRTSPYFNLGALAEVADSETSAQGITDPDPNGRIQVVGWNESEDLGLVWTRETPESDWQVYDLNNHLVRCSTGWAIFRADDVSDSGLIIAIADPEGGNVVLHAVLLTPAEVCPQCDSDLNGDGEVTINDFIILVSEWGPCSTEPAEWCRSDINCDDTVNINDFLLMVAQWGPCDAPGGGMPQTVQDCIDRFGFGYPELLEKCICAVEPEECSEE